MICQVCGHRISHRALFRLLLQPNTASTPLQTSGKRLHAIVIHCASRSQETYCKYEVVC